ncbi:MAG: hypothetical protein NC307_09580 [Roseburia sp.]|nr:hypothetical protein [Roseburia sp.]
MKSKPELLERIASIENDLAILEEKVCRDEIEISKALVISSIHRAELHSIQIQLAELGRGK